MKKILFLFSLSFFCLKVSAQKTLPEKERLAFDTHFFAGQKEKMIRNFDEAEKEFKLALAIQPDAADINFQTATVLFSNKKRDEALMFAEKAVKFAPENEWYAKFLINCYKETNRIEDAIAQCERSFKATKAKHFLSTKAELQLRNRKYKDAIKTYDQLEKNFGFIEQYTRQKEQLYLLLNNPKKAIQTLEEYLAVTPDNINIKGMLADLYMSYKQEQKAFKFYQEILQVDPKNGNAAFSLADFYKLNGKREQYFEMVKLGMASNIEPRSKLKMLAILIPSNEFGSDHLIKCDTLVDIFIATNASNAEPFLFKGDLSLQKRDFETARLWYFKAIEVNPSELVAWEQIIVCDQQLQRFDWMKEDCEKMIEVFPQFPTPYLFHVVASKQLGLEKEALPLARKGVEMATDEESLISLLMSLGDIAFYTNEFQLSDSCFEAVLALSPENSLALNNYAYFLSLQNKDLDKAENLSKRSLVFDPKNPASLDTYGWILFMKGNYEEAKIQIEKSLSYYENSAEVIEHYGDVLYRLGQTEKALEQWKKAAALGANSPALIKKIQTKLLP